MSWSHIGLDIRAAGPKSLDMVDFKAVSPFGPNHEATDNAEAAPAIKDSRLGKTGEVLSLRQSASPIISRSSAPIFSPSSIARPFIATIHNLFPSHFGGKSVA